MPDKKEPTFADLLLQGAREVAAHAAGEDDAVPAAGVTRRPITARQVGIERPATPSPQDIRQIRDKLAVSQSVFSDLLNVSLSTVRAWEQGQRTPDGPSLRLLELADRNPGALLELANVRATAPVD